MRNILTLVIGLFCLLGYTSESSAQFWKKREIKIESKVRKSGSSKSVGTEKKSDYERLLGDKHEVKKGLIDLHRIENRLYFEFPNELLGKDMVIGSTVSEISDAGNALIGQKPHYPLYVRFIRVDSTVFLTKVENDNICEYGKKAKAALDKSNIPAFIKSFDIKATSPDGEAIVFEATSLFQENIPELDPFDPYSGNTYYGFVSRRTSFQHAKSCMKEIKSFEKNIVVKSYMSYNVSLNVLGRLSIQDNKPFTALMTRTIMLLPEEKMEPRVADPRINFFVNGKYLYSPDEEGVKAKYFINRWRLEPEDKVQYMLGKKVKPLKPITVYIDNAFPKEWRKYIVLGVNDWNDAFEKIGFKDAVVVKDFPKNDPEFDPDDLRYTCVRYCPTMVPNSMGPSWIDPRTGEIINASVYLYHNIVKLLHDWRFVQTAQVDPRVRKKIFDEEVLGESMRYVAAHEFGHCLGLMHNMSASNSFPVDSLRSAKFTNKYGTTPSIMDYARNNYIAQPGDKGLKLTPPNIGVYDYFSIKWGYQPIKNAESYKEEEPTLRKWIDEKYDNPMYRYGKQQIYSLYDPRSQNEDLGDDLVKASTYGIKNLKYILKNLDKWIEEDKGSDPDYTYLSDMYDQIYKQYIRYVDHVFVNIGGIYLNEVYRGNDELAFKPVPKNIQKNSLNFIFSQLNTLDWIENKEIIRKTGLAQSKSRELKKTIFKTLFRKTDQIALCSYYAKNPYGVDDYLNDIHDYVWEKSLKNKSLTNNDKYFQIEYVDALLKQADKSGGSGNEIVIGITDEKQSYEDMLYNEYSENYNELKNELIKGFGFQQKVKPGVISVMPEKYYDLVYRTKELLEKKVKVSKDKNHYNYLLIKIKRFLKI